MRVDKLKKVDRLPKRSGCDFPCDCRAQSQPTPMDIGAVGKEKSGKGGKGSNGAGKRGNSTQQACSWFGNTEDTSANCPHSDKRVEHVERLDTWQVCVCRSSGTPQPKAKGGQKGKGGGKGASAAKRVGTVVRVDMSSQCPKKKVHAVEESSTTASQAGSHDTFMVGSIGSCFDVGSVSEVTLKPRGADEKI